MAITDINLSGTVRDDAGNAVNGITVYLLHTAAALNGTQEATDTTDSNGVWNFTEASLDTTYDIKITSGSQNRYIPWSDEITLKTVDTSVLKVRGVEAAAAPLYFFADQADDAGDGWRIQASTSDTLAIGSDKAAAGTIIDYITITNGANAAASNTTILGQLTIGVNDTGADVKFFGATSGNYWLWDESADGVVQIGTLTVGVDDTGHDVKFFGATAGQYFLWDESADELVLAGDTKLSFHDAAGGENIIASANGHLEVNAGTTLDMTAPTVDLNSSTEFNIDTAIYDLNASGAVTIDADGLTTITGTNNAVGTIYLRENAGTAGTVKIHADQGTSVTEGAESVTILSDAGGVGIRSTANLANAVNITVDGGTTSSMTLFNDQGTGATEGSASIQLLSDAGGINIKSGLNGANAILLTADAGTSETIVIHADQGSGTGSIELLSDAGGIKLTAASDVIIPSGVGLILDGSGDEKIESDGTDINISVGSNGDINLPSNVGICFGDDSDKIEGDGTNLTVTSSGYLNLKAGGTEFLRISTAGLVTIHDDDHANTNMTMGLTINQMSNDDEILCLKSSDVSHGVTTVSENTSFGVFQKDVATGGGLRITALNDAQGGDGAMHLRAISTPTPTTGKATSSIGVINLIAQIDDGTGVADVATNGDLVTIRNNATTRFIFDAEGSGHADVEWVAFDAYDDVALMDAVQSVAAGRMTPARYGGNSLYYNKEYLESSGIIGKDSWHEEDGKQRQMVNFTKLSMLHHGAILQIGDSIKATEDRLHALEVENRELKLLMGGN
jgi:hypothetical protein